MTNSNTISNEPYPDSHHDLYSKTVFGFWVYILTDFVLFGVLFATYAVLHNNVFNGPSSKDLFNLPYTLGQTLILLSSSFTVGIAGAFAHRRNKKATITFFILTFLLGVAFLWMEIAEFRQLIELGNSWKKSAFLSSYFTLIGTHGLHVMFGMLFTIILLLPVFSLGLTATNIRRLTCLRMFWQFLNIVWVFIFSFVYLMGAY